METQFFEEPRSARDWQKAPGADQEKGALLALAALGMLSLGVWEFIQGTNNRIQRVIHSENVSLESDNSPNNIIEIPEAIDTKDLI